MSSLAAKKDPALSLFVISYLPVCKIESPSSLVSASASIKFAVQGTQASARRVIDEHSSL
eukprot:195352-Rhodomonas_salina.3